jgi:hypothetical protein
MTESLPQLAPSSNSTLSLVSHPPPNFVEKFSINQEAVDFLSSVQE